MQGDRSPGAPILLFDGVCNLCTASVRWVLPRDPDGNFRFASLQSEVGRKLLLDAGGNPEELDSVVLLEGGRLWERSTAALRVARKLKAPWPLLYAFILVPRPIRDWVYDLVARHRYRIFGRKEECMIPEPGVQERFLDG
ncbi:MAG: thiol-disulfide oxidoreductase DCC family protein [Gemmatimonadota bacterium]